MKKMMWVLALLLPIALTNCAKRNGAADASQAADEAETETMKTADNEEANAEAMTQEPVTKAGITVIEASACRSVENRSANGVEDTFPADVGRIFFFTNIQLPDTTQTSIQHIWIYEGKKMATVKLPIRGPRWRTYSSKAIDPAWKGNWQVDITSTSGDLIKSTKFVVK